MFFTGIGVAEHVFGMITQTAPESEETVDHEAEPFSEEGSSRGKVVKF